MFCYDSNCHGFSLFSQIIANICSCNLCLTGACTESFKKKIVCRTTKPIESSLLISLYLSLVFSFKIKYFKSCAFKTITPQLSKRSFDLSPASQLPCLLLLLYYEVCMPVSLHVTKVRIYMCSWI